MLITDLKTKTYHKIVGNLLVPSLSRRSPRGRNGYNMN
jgi:hypothetical protein